jgi:23S rRNA A1618 N6-methylase RlmF
MVASPFACADFRVPWQTRVMLDVVLVAGTADEMVCPGGEQAFVGAMVADSLQLRDRIHW